MAAIFISQAKRLQVITPSVGRRQLVFARTEEKLAGIITARSPPTATGNRPLRVRSARSGTAGRAPADSTSSLRVLQTVRLRAPHQGVPRPGGPRHFPR